MLDVCARTRNFLNAPGIHYFPSRVWLDVYHLRFRLFPEPLLRSLKSANSPTAQTARIFTFTSQMLFFGNNLRLDGTHLRLDELFAEGRYFAPLPFQSGVVLVTLRSIVHLRSFL